MAAAVYFYSVSAIVDLNKKNVSPPTGLSKSTTLSTPGFTRGHNSNAPSELHFIFNHNLSVKSVEFVASM
jgi:hypothetical protein